MKTITLIIILIMLTALASAESGMECNCTSCDDCKLKLNSACTTVVLTADIINYTSTCIDNPENFTEKTFDCRGHTIDGTYAGPAKGIYLVGKENNTIKNCIMTEIQYMIYLKSSSNNNNIINNSCSGGTTGILLFSVDNNNIINNTANGNGNGIQVTGAGNKVINNTATGNSKYGLYLYSSTSSNITNNTFCGNADYDIYTNSETGNGGNNNCTTSNWNDTSIIGCGYNCNGSVNICDSCTTCNTALNSSSKHITLLSDVINQTGTCINNPANFIGKTFDCQGHTIDGRNMASTYGIYLEDQENNTIKSCTITQFETGIYFFTSSHSNITNNNLSGNVYYGLYQYWMSIYNRITDNTITGNGARGILLVASGGTYIHNNTMSNNYLSDITLYDADETILDYGDKTGNLDIKLSGYSSTPYNITMRTACPCPLFFSGARIINENLTNFSNAEYILRIDGSVEEEVYYGCAWEIDRGTVVIFVTSLSALLYWQRKRVRSLIERLKHRK